MKNTPILAFVVMCLLTACSSEPQKTEKVLIYEDSIKALASFLKYREDDMQEIKKINDSITLSISLEYQNCDSIYNPAFWYFWKEKTDDLLKKTEDTNPYISHNYRRTDCFNPKRNIFPLELTSLSFFSAQKPFLIIERWTEGRCGASGRMEMEYLITADSEIYEYFGCYRCEGYESVWKKESSISAAFQSTIALINPDPRGAFSENYVYYEYLLTYISKNKIECYHLELNDRLIDLLESKAIQGKIDF